MYLISVSRNVNVVRLILERSKGRNQTNNERARTVLKRTVGTTSEFFNEFLR